MAASAPSLAPNASGGVRPFSVATGTPPPSFYSWGETLHVAPMTRSGIGRHRHPLPRPNATGGFLFHSRRLRPRLPPPSQGYPHDVPLPPPRATARRVYKGCYRYTGSGVLPSLALIASPPRSPALSHSLQGGGLSPTTHNAAPVSHESSHCSTVCNGGFCWEEWGIRPQHRGDNSVPVVFHGVPVPLPARVRCSRVRVGVWQKIPGGYPCHPLFGAVYWPCTLVVV